MNAKHELVISPTRRSALKRLYGMDESDLLALLDIVSHCCPMCLRPFTPTRIPQMDHDHDSGELRGPACSRDNHDLLGRFGDDPEFYQRVADYLRNPPAASLPGPRRRAPNAAPRS